MPNKSEMYKVIFESSRDAIVTLELPNWNYTHWNNTKKLDKKHCKVGVYISLSRSNLGKYLLKDQSTIIQVSRNNKDNWTTKNITHIITDTIENKEDRLKVSEKIIEFLAQ